MDDALHMDSDVGILEAIDARTAAVTMRKQRKRVARDLLEYRIVVSAGEGHRQCAT